MFVMSTFASKSILPRYGSILTDDGTEPTHENYDVLIIVVIVIMMIMMMNVMIMMMIVMMIIVIVMIEVFHGGNNER